MSAVERYLAELGAALHVRGAARRRFLRECRDHLADAAAARGEAEAARASGKAAFSGAAERGEAGAARAADIGAAYQRGEVEAARAADIGAAYQRGEAEAVRAFGPPAEVAAAFDAEVAARRGVRATFATAAGVLATGGSTLALIRSAQAGATAPTFWAVVFFVAAQLAAVAAGLALLQALVARRSALTPADAALLARRNACALLAAGTTMFAAGAALPGRGSALLLLAGPVLVSVALVAVLRARSLARRLEGSRAPAVRPPLEDLRALTGLPLPLLGAGSLLLLTTAVAAAAAFARDLAEHATVGGALVTACIEVLAVVGCFLVLGRPLGLWRPSGRAASTGVASG